MERLESYTPAWPLPKIFRLTSKGKLIEGMFEGKTINTPSMLAVEDYLVSLNWAKVVGGLKGLIARCEANAGVIAEFCAKPGLDRQSGRRPGNGFDDQRLPEIHRSAHRRRRWVCESRGETAGERGRRAGRRSLPRRAARTAHLVRRDGGKVRRCCADAVDRLGVFSWDRRAFERPHRPSIPGEGRDPASFLNSIEAPACAGAKTPNTKDPIMAPKVLVSDALSETAVQIFRDRGVEVDYLPDLGKDKEKLLSVIGNYDGLAIRSATKVSDKLLAAATRLKVIGRAGIGVDNVDIPAASKQGVIVMNTPFGNSVTTAEHAIAMMFAVARQLPEASASTHAGKWEKNRFMGTEVFNKTLGVIGAGNIGSVSSATARWGCG